ncbi:MAG: alpha/beta fold hydrolase [Neisseriaceae bacterium]
MINPLKYILNKHIYNLGSYETKFLKLHDGIIEYYSFGKGPPLFLVMGYAATMNAWDFRLLAELAKFYQVILFNNRNTGNSIFKTDDYTLTDLADDIEKLRINLKLDKINLLGISMGGIIAQKYANGYPGNLSNLILINTLPPGNLSEHPSYQVENALRNLSEGNLKSYLRLFYLIFSKPWYWLSLWVFHFKPHGSKNIVSKETIRKQQEILEEWNKLLDPEKFLNKITTNTLIFVGGKDRIVPPINSKILKKCITNSKLVNFSNGGHLLIYEYPKLARVIINSLILNFSKLDTN